MDGRERLCGDAEKLMPIVDRLVYGFCRRAKQYCWYDEFQAEAYYWLWLLLLRYDDGTELNEERQKQIFSGIRRALACYYRNQRESLELQSVQVYNAKTHDLADNLQTLMDNVVRNTDELAVLINWMAGTPFHGLSRRRVTSIKTALKDRLGYKPRPLTKSRHLKPIPVAKEERVQTFLPYADFHKSAKVLDNKRLGKQRVECKQIVLALERGKGAWYNHPATVMWSKNVTALCKYGQVICQEWQARGFTDSLLEFFESRLEGQSVDNPIVNPIDNPIDMPKWLGDDRVHSSHRSNLLRKDPEFYRSFGWQEAEDLPYTWPLPGGVVQNRGA